MDTPLEGEELVVKLVEKGFPEELARSQVEAGGEAIYEDKTLVGIFLPLDKLARTDL